MQLRVTGNAQKIRVKNNNKEVQNYKGKYETSLEFLLLELGGHCY